MEYYGDVTYDGILKDEWCNLRVLGSISEKIRVELGIYHNDGKMGIMHITQDDYREEGYFCCETFVPCEYEEIGFLHTTEGTYLLVTKQEKQGVIALSA